MTREEAIKKHRKMWSWLAENPWKTKFDYLIKFDTTAELLNGCYHCEYADGECDRCPLEWPGRGSCSFGGLYDVWADCMENRDYGYAAEIARQIADLPEKEEIR